MLSSLIKHAKKKKIIFLSTPYDEKSSDLLEKFNMPAYKIASTDTNNFKLSHIAKKKKPIILSTAMCNEGVIKSINFLKKGCKASYSDALYRKLSTKLRNL